MAKYRLVTQEFTFDFRIWSTSNFPTITFNQPGIYVGCYIPQVSVLSIPYPPTENVPIQESVLYGFRAVCAFGENLRVIQPAKDLMQLIMSDSIDCSELEVTGDLTLYREDLLMMADFEWVPRMCMVYLQKIN